MTISPGWYKDPAEPSTQRYWDGEGWVGAPLPIDATPPPGTPAAPPEPPPTRAPEIVQPQPPAPAEEGFYGAPLWAPQGLLASPVRPHGFPLASPGIRLAARVIDFGVLLLLNAVVNGWFIYLFWQDFVPWSESLVNSMVEQMPYPPPPERLGSLTIVIPLLAMALWFAYEVPATAQNGQTLGKRLYDIKVVRVEGLEPLGFLRAWRRWNPLGAPLFLCAPTLLFACCGPFALILQALDVMFVPLDRTQRMALHDRSAGTYVVQLPRSTVRKGS
jgi:uncharacterized RDD family membrane protein YckC